MIKVYNKLRDVVPDDAVQIGIPSEYGNPFVIGRDGSRKQVIEQYKFWVLNQPKLIRKIRSELKGKSVVCFCSPKACHGDIIIKIANYSGGKL